METKEKSQSPVIRLFSVDLQIPSEPCEELWVQPCRKERKLHKQEVRKPKQSDLMVKELWRVFNHSVS